MGNDLVSIIMLSRNRAEFVAESVRSVMAQTYTNWELLFVDDNSTDDTIHQMMELKGKDKRISDVWAPDKLERQIRFMEEHGYAFSYTKYGLMNLQSQDRGVVIGGKAHVDYREMRKCCWPAYLTVMYDAEKIGRMFTRSQGANNDYALWLNVCERADCHLLDECLATMRTPWGLLGKLLLTQKFKWRYDSFRVEEDLGPVKALLYTIRNGFYGLVKWMRYVKRV